MTFRFRYLGPDGGEVEVDSLEGLRALMESGKVGELTLLYDVLTGEWARARTLLFAYFWRKKVQKAGVSCQTSG